MPGKLGGVRSQIRTSLHRNSLLTGNFTGKIAVSGLLGPISWQEAAVPQRLFAQFPTQINWENISKNRDFLASNREFYLGKSLYLEIMVAVCTENLNSDVVMMKSAEDGERFDASGPLNRARNRRIFVQ